MPVYFSWSMDSNLPACNQSIKIFKLSISQREGEVAIATLRILAEETFGKELKYGYISFQSQHGERQLLFKGKLLGFPRQISKGLAEIELSAEPEDALEQLKRLADSLKIEPYFDELFVKENDDNPVNILEARSDLFHWDRATGQVNLSDLFNGAKAIDLSKDILANSLKLKVGDTLIDSINVILSCEWIQQAEGEINIYPKIAAAFPKSKVNTLTAAGLIAEWPKVDDKIGPSLSRKLSGYQVVQSYLKEIMPPSTGVLDIYPTLTPEITIKHDEKVKSLRLKRSWFKGELFLHWHYRQKRRENLTFTLHQESHLKGKIRPRHKQLNIQLQSIEKHLPNAGCSSFFITKRGCQAVHHAIEMAKAYLAGSSRCVEVEFMVPFDKALSIDLDTSVRLCSGLIPGGELIGKVTEYRLVQNGLNSYGWVRLAVAVGRICEGVYLDAKYMDCHVAFAPHNDEGFPLSRAKRDDPEKLVYALDYFKSESASHTTASGISYASYNEQQPREGILHPQNLSIHDLVRSVKIKGSAEEQIRFLLENEFPKSDDVVQLLPQVPTVVNVELLDLRTKPVLEHAINLEILNAWSAPEQVRLG